MFAFFSLGAQEILILLILAFLGIGGAVGIVLLVMYLTRAGRRDPEE